MNQNKELRNGGLGKPFSKGWQEIHAHTELGPNNGGKDANSIKLDNVKTRTHSAGSGAGGRKWVSSFPHPNAQAVKRWHLQLKQV